MKKIIVIPDTHFGLQPSYVDEDYPRHIFAVFMSIVKSNPDAVFILTGDVFHNAGVKSKYSVEEFSSLFSLLSENKLLIVQGNGKHAHDIYKHSETFEERYSKPDGNYIVAGFKVGIIGYKKTQEELDEAVKLVKGADFIVTHNFLHGGFGGAVFPNVGQMVIAGHDHSFVNGVDRVALGSLVNTDFGSYGDKYYLEVEDGNFHFKKINCMEFESILWEPGMNLEKIKKPGVVTRVVLDDPNPDLVQLVSKYADVVLVDAKAKEEKGFTSVSDDVVLDFNAEWENFSDGEPSEVVALGKEALDAVE